jgi:PmbA protein
MLSRHGYPDVFLYEQEQLAEIAMSVIHRASLMGATDASVSVSEADNLMVTVRHHELDVMQRNRSKQISLTVYAGERRGSASSTDLSESAIQAALNAAWHIASFTTVDPCAGPADSEFLEHAPLALDLFHPWVITPQEAIELARDVEGAALEVSPLIINDGDATAFEGEDITVNSGGASVSAYHSQFFTATSRGFRGGYAQSMHGISCMIIAGNAQGMQTGRWHVARRSASDMGSPQVIGQTAAMRALARLNARQLTTGVWPVLFEAPVASSLVQSLVAAASGDAQFRGQTFLYESIGCQVMSDHLTLVERPHEPKGLASAPFDAEGVSTTDRTVVDSGVLRSYFLTSYSARKLGLQPTGHAGGPHNLCLSSSFTAASDDLESMLRKLKRGLLVTNVTSQGVNIVTGDYSRGVSGFWVDEGRIQYPVEEITIAGNLREMLQSIVAVGSDIYTQGAITTGSVLIDRMQIAGL